MSILEIKNSIINQLSQYLINNLNNIIFDYYNNDIGYYNIWVYLESKKLKRVIIFGQKLEYATLEKLKCQFREYKIQSIKTNIKSIRKLKIKDKFQIKANFIFNTFTDEIYDFYHKKIRRKKSIY